MVWCGFLKWGKNQAISDWDLGSFTADCLLGDGQSEFGLCIVVICSAGEKNR